MKSVTKRLKDLSGKDYQEFNYPKLYSRYAGAVKERQARDRSVEADRYVDNSMDRKIDQLRKVVAEELQKECERVNGSLPVASYFDAYQIAKKASDANKRDVGAGVLATYLHKLWEKNRTASLTANDFLRMRDHYETNYPRSVAASVIDEIGQKGYADLPMSDLLAIAANIESQDDYEYQIKAHGLASNSPRNKKARQFIIAAVNGKEAQEGMESSGQDKSYQVTIYKVESQEGMEPNYDEDESIYYEGLGNLESISTIIEDMGFSETSESSNWWSTPSTDGVHFDLFVKNIDRSDLDPEEWELFNKMVQD